MAADHKPEAPSVKSLPTNRRECPGGEACSGYRPGWASLDLRRYEKLEHYWKSADRWLKMSIGVLKGVGQKDCSAWTKLLFYLVMGEHHLPVSPHFYTRRSECRRRQMGQLPSGKLPKDAGTWVLEMAKRSRLNRKTSEKFAQEWQAWWASLQPHHRIQISSDPVEWSHEPLNPDGWDSLRKSGPAGMFNVVHGLALCYPAFKTSGPSSKIMTAHQWHLYVYDVAWVYEQMLAKFATRI